MMLPDLGVAGKRSAIGSQDLVGPRPTVERVHSRSRIAR